AASGISSILNSTCRGGGSPGKSSGPQRSYKSLARLAVLSLLVLSLSLEL
nr:hypothetical protein [Tanacetum cinerariifolium]